MLIIVNNLDNKILYNKLKDWGFLSCVLYCICCESYGDELCIVNFCKCIEFEINFEEVSS